MRIGVVLCVAVVSAALGALAATPVQDAQAKSKSSGDQPGQPSAAEMEAWIKAATPGEEHKALEEMVGEWKSTVTMTMKPGEPSQTSTGNDEFKMTMDGRYLEQEHVGTMMGQPFKGHGLYGYNNASGEYESVWHDNMGTGLMFSKGPKDASTDAITFTGEYECPINGPSKSRHTLRKVSDDEYVFEMYATYPGKAEFKAMEIKYTRAQ